MDCDGVAGVFSGILNTFVSFGISTATFGLGSIGLTLITSAVSEMATNAPQIMGCSDPILQAQQQINEKLEELVQQLVTLQEAVDFDTAGKRSC